MINVQKLNFKDYLFNWQKWILIIIGIIISFILIIIPIIFIFWQGFHCGLNVALRSLRNNNMLHAIYLTLLISIITIIINLVFGILTSWLITNFSFPARQLLISIFDIPLAVSPVIVGLIYLISWGINGPIGYWLNKYNIQIIFAWPGMTLTTIFLTSPLILRELIPALLKKGNIENEAAISIGSSGYKIFKYITLPNIRWALIHGIILTISRSIGEFGAVSVVSGSIRGETYTLPLQVELLYQDYNIVGAFTASSLLTIIALIILIIKNLSKYKLKLIRFNT